MSKPGRQVERTFKSTEEFLKETEERALRYRSRTRKRDKSRLGSAELRRIDAVKGVLCNQIYRSALRSGLDQRKAAAHLGTTISCVSHVYTHRYDRVTLNQLFRYLVILEPGFRVLVAV